MSKSIFDNYTMIILNFSDFFKLVYTIWCIFWLGMIFLLLFPFTAICLQREGWYRYAHWLNRLWGQIFFGLAGIKIVIEYRYKPKPNHTYVFCANHFSYLDIATMGLIIENYFAFVGKQEVKHIPLLGYMFRKLHIQVDRDNSQSRVGSLSRSLKTLAQGRSIVIFPEGGIKAKKPPKMHFFKDGAFKMAIQQQVPIVPIVLLNNYKILPDGEKIHFSRQKLRVVVHNPLPTVGLNQEDALTLKEKCFQIIDETLSTYHNR
ncbi:MAG: lysophospholipid acyltransferase family protein [Spirosomataceae bacterium]